VPFADLFERRDFLKGIRRIRANTALTYVIAIGWVSVATLLRFVIEGEVPDTIPFTTYSLALIVAASLGGFWPGMVALVLAAIGGWFLFLPPIYSFALEPKDMWALIVFVIVGGINVAVLSALMTSVLARDEYQQFLRRELQHRSQNLFAIIQAIASRTLVEGQTIAESKEAFTARLAALARTHALLESGAWAGAALKEIIVQELLGFENQISVRGCDIVVNTPAAQHFALIVHELTTNAVKHGALSCPEGRVAIEGSVEGDNAKDQFRFAWKESGGPTVTPPMRQGFGSAILFGSEKRFGQNVEAKYAQGGFTYDVIVSRQKIAARQSRPPPANGIMPYRSRGPSLDPAKVIMDRRGGTRHSE
jgi:two-component sensor histidine kinase